MLSWEVCCQESNGDVRVWEVTTATDPGVLVRYLRDIASRGGRHAAPERAEDKPLSPLPLLSSLARRHQPEHTHPGGFKPTPDQASVVRRVVRVCWVWVACVALAVHLLSQLHSSHPDPAHGVSER